MPYNGHISRILYQKGALPLALKQGSSNGPDWMDVALMMAEIQHLHACSVSLEMSPVGAHGEGGLDLMLCAVPSLAQGGGQRRCVSLKLRNPPTEPTKMSAHVYRLTHELDRDLLAQWWVNGQLF